MPEIAKTQISLEDLRTTWRTLQMLRADLRAGSSWHLTAACTPIEIRVRGDYGQDAWDEMISQDLSGKEDDTPSP